MWVVINQGDLFSMNTPLPKSPYGNVKMVVYFDIID